MTATDGDLWTLDQLAERVEGALAVGYDGATNGRVRSVPDRRAIRWYTTIGLVDRPAATRGRTALYGERHLLQLVAIKRRQAAGRSLAEIQAELTGATDAALREIARLPAGTPLPAPTPAAAPRTPRFWSAPAGSGHGNPPADLAAVGADTARPAPVAMVPALALGDGVTLVLPAGSAVPDAAGLRAIRRAAEPLLHELVRLGVSARSAADPGVIEPDQLEGSS